MKLKMVAFISVLTSFTILISLFAVNVQAAMTITDNKIGTIDGYDYELWKDTGTTSMTLNEAGAFSCQWSNVNNVLFLSGKRFDRTKTPQQIGNISISYDCNFQPNGNAYLGVYGWMIEPNIEFYIVESWGTWKPPGLTSKGTITVDGGTYDIYQSVNRSPKLAIVGSTIYQYWSVRTSKRTSGTVSVSEHFKAWESKGMSMGKMYEVALLVEGYQSSGKADVTEMRLNIDSSKITSLPTNTSISTQTNTSTITPVNTPVKCIEDINGDGAINMADVILLASAYNTTKKDEGYIEKYDLDNNGAINMSDIMMVAAKFNQLVA